MMPCADTPPEKVENPAGKKEYLVKLNEIQLLNKHWIKMTYREADKGRDWDTQGGVCFLNSSFYFLVLDSMEGFSAPAKQH